MDTSSTLGNSDGGGTSSRTQPRQGVQLPTALQLHILSFLPHNDRALSGRLTCRELHDALSKVACMFQPLPAHAVAWAKEDWQQHAKRLPFQHKLQLLCAAAKSGCEANLDVAWAFLQLSMFPEVLREGRAHPRYPNPGEAAAEAGHAHLLPWLLQRCPGLLRPDEVLREAAWGCDLAGLESVWEALCSFCPGDSSWSGEDVYVDTCVVEGAAQSATPDAEDKMEWALGMGPRIREATAAMAARSGELRPLQVLHRHGCPMGRRVLLSALEHADLAVAQWLVDEAGVDLPAAAGQAEIRAISVWWKDALVAAAECADGVAKLQWLRERGAPPLGSDRDLTYMLVRAAVRAGQLEVLRHLLSGFGPDAVVQANPGLAAAESGSVPMAEYLRQAGLVFTAGAYEAAARAGKTVMVWWLAQEAGVSAAGLDLGRFIERWKGKSQHLLETVQLLVEDAGCRGWGAAAALCASAKRGDLALVHYLLQQTPEYKPDWEVLVAAAEGGCEALLEWLVEQHPGCVEGAVTGSSPYVPAASNGDLGTLTALRRLGVPWGVGDVVVQAVKGVCSVGALRWLLEQGAPVGSAEAMEASLESHVLNGWLRREGAERRRALLAAVLQA